jgi:heme/copper-type cytochrome/quinol oxidase subunit 2
MLFGFTAPSSPIMEGIVDLHNHIFFFLILIFVFVFWLFTHILWRFWWAVRTANGGPLADRRSLVALRHLNHSTNLEIVWTLVPSLILVAVAIPSFALLYAMDEVLEPTLTLKAVGHQWYWSYQYSNCIAPLHYVPLDHPELTPQSLWDRVWFNASLFTHLLLADPDVAPPPVGPRPDGPLDSVWFRDWWTRRLVAAKVTEALSAPVTLAAGPSLPTVAFDSYMLAEDELRASGDYRLLEVDEPVVLPTQTHLRLLVTAEDVIHSFALPAAGVKLDAVPGRLNQQGLFLNRQGTFYGQCSELCGVNHGFMPIVVKGVSMKEFVHWYLTKLHRQDPSLGLALADPEAVHRWLTAGQPPAGYGLDRHPNPLWEEAAATDAAAAHGTALMAAFEEAQPGALRPAWTEEFYPRLPSAAADGFRVGEPTRPLLFDRSLGLPLDPGPSDGKDPAGFWGPTVVRLGGRCLRGRTGAAAEPSIFHATARMRPQE